MHRSLPSSRQVGRVPAESSRQTSAQQLRLPICWCERAAQRYCPDWLSIPRVCSSLCACQYCTILCRDCRPQAVNNLSKFICAPHLQSRQSIVQYTRARNLHHHPSDPLPHWWHPHSRCNSPRPAVWCDRPLRVRVQRSRLRLGSCSVP